MGAPNSNGGKGQQMPAMNAQAGGQSGYGLSQGGGGKGQQMPGMNTMGQQQNALRSMLGNQQGMASRNMQYSPQSQMAEMKADPNNASGYQLDNSQGPYQTMEQRIDREPMMQHQGMPAQGGMSGKGQQMPGMQGQGGSGKGGQPPGPNATNAMFGNRLSMFTPQGGALSYGMGGQNPNAQNPLGSLGGGGNPNQYAQGNDAWAGGSQMAIPPMSGVAGQAAPPPAAAAGAAPPGAAPGAPPAGAQVNHWGNFSNLMKSDPYLARQYGNLMQVGDDDFMRSNQFRIKKDFFGGDAAKYNNWINSNEAGGANWNARGGNNFVGPERDRLIQMMGGTQPKYYKNAQDEALNTAAGQSMAPSAAELEKRRAARAAHVAKVQGGYVPGDTTYKK